MIMIKAYQEMSEWLYMHKFIITNDIDLISPRIKRPVLYNTS